MSDLPLLAVTNLGCEPGVESLARAIQLSVSPVFLLAMGLLMAAVLMLVLEIHLGSRLASRF
ncbi:MAG: hypothetical protein FJ054_13470 [Cyanobacteria bacterium M_surface_10_m2_119]|nr:hypothetical protein [Cyanobacteria bacterium M_surface_10_m2_119]